MKKILLSVFSGFVVSGVINAQVGTFDPTFNQGGWGSIGTSYDYLRIISTGNETCILTRNEAAFPPYPSMPYSSGALASLTNVSGSSFTSTDIGVYAGSGQFSQVTDVYKASNGKIYAVGYEKFDNTNSTNPKFFINRYSAEGVIDPTFNNGQTFFIEAGSYYYGVKVRPLSDNKILIAGNLSFGPLFLLRFKENGTPDSTFGTNGLYTFNFLDGFPQYITDMMVLSTGKILIAGRAKDITNNGGYEVGFVARLNADGSLDNTCGFKYQVQQNCLQNY
jgi:uncharacterized delta-60 repeat protein